MAYIYTDSLSDLNHLYKIKSRFKTTSSVFIRPVAECVIINAVFDFINVYHFGGSTDDEARVKKSERWKQEHIKKSTVYINF